MRSHVIAFVTVVAFAAVATIAPRDVGAEDFASYEVEGEADAAADDPRVAALDEAFGRAITQAVGELVDAENRKTHKAALNQHIIGRARLWVAKFTVSKDSTDDGRRQLTVVVRVDRDKMRVRLAELNIPLAQAGSDVSKPGTGTKTITVLVRLSDPSGARASFGASAEKELPGLGALAGALRAAGMAIRRAPASGPAVKAGNDLPLDDDAAEALATEAKAEHAAIANVVVGAPVPLRGVAESGVLVVAKLRAIGRGKKLIGEGTAAVAARSAEASAVDAAIDRAIVAAASDVVPPAPAQLGKAGAFSGDDTPIAEPGVVLVRLAAKTPWGLVAAEQKYLSGAKGVQRAAIRRASPAGWIIGVTTTESVEKIAQIARKAPAADTAVKVKVVGDVVEVSLSGAP